MKTIPFLFLMLLACPVLIMAQRQTAPAQTQRQVLTDFRVDRPLSDPKLSLATQRTVLAKVFRKYLTDESKCASDFDASSGNDPLRAARNAGQMVPSVVDVTTGSFTARGQTQTLYVIAVSECNASHADNFGTKRVAIFSGPRLVADLDVDFKSSIVRKTDLNADGIDELLMTGGDTNQGITVETAALIDFENGRRHVIRDFGMVSEDSCASGIRGSTVKAAVIYNFDALPGMMPKLRVDNYAAPCSKARRWRFLSTGKMPE